ncbi:MAG: ATP-binding protein, partial [Saprospiraceae bacterium]
LTVITGMANQINRHLQSEELGKIVYATQMIKRNGRQLLDLMNQLLDVAKLEENHLTPELRTGDIFQYLDFIIQSFIPPAENKAVELHYQPAINECIVNYDPNLIHRLLSNLLSNAIKFTEAGGSVEVSADWQNDCLLLIVSDTGQGMTPEVQEQIFQRFYHDETTVNAEGSGLGLAMVKEIVTVLKGKIEVESAPQQGSTFTVEIPLGAAVTVATEPLINQPITTVKSSVGVSQEQLSILIAEDNQDIAHYIQTCLPATYQTTFVIDGEQAYEQACASLPDLIISDILMPKKDGLELCKSLKTDERTAHIPIILLTAKVTQADRLRGLQLGADVYLTKPFDREELLLHIAGLINKRTQLQLHFQRQLKQPEAVINDPFLEKVNELLEEELTNSDLSVQQLADQLYLSRVQLHRKLKALTDFSATAYIRQFRLQRANFYLLTQPKWSVKRVALESGFRDSSYFSKMYFKMYQQTPSDYRNNQ